MANVTFVDCNGGFMAHGKINNKLMPDALHPNPAGADAERGPMLQGTCGPCYTNNCCRRHISFCDDLLLVNLQVWMCWQSATGACCRIWGCSNTQDGFVCGWKTDVHGLACQLFFSVTTWKFKGLL